MQHADWQMRLGAQRGELAEYAARLRDHPFLAKTVDLARIDALLTNWPELEAHDPVDALPRSFGITRALTAASFIGYAEGRMTSDPPSADFLEKNKCPDCAGP